MLYNDAVLSAMVESGVPLGVSVSGTSQAETIDRAVSLGIFTAVQATWNLHERAAEDALARCGLKVIVKEALANGRLAARDAEALAAALAQAVGDGRAQRRGFAGRAALEPARLRDAAAGRSARAGRGQRGLLGAARTTGVELSVRRA